MPGECAFTLDPPCVRPAPSRSALSRPRPHRPHPLVAPLLWAPPPGPLFPILPGPSLFPPAALSAFVVSSPAPWPNCLPWVPPQPRPWAPPLLLTTPPAASGALVAAPTGAAAGLPAAGTPSAARGLPAARGHPRVGRGRGSGLGVLSTSFLAVTPVSSQAAAPPPGTETLSLHSGALSG